MGRRVPKPLGILTDRDIVCGQLDRAGDLHCLVVGDVMTRDPLTVRAELEVTEAIRALSARGVRRAPVVDSSGALIGVVTLDDLLPEVAQQLNALAGVASAQIHHARRPT
jgi:CBS domain-containing protein